MVDSDPILGLLGVRQEYTLDVVLSLVHTSSPTRMFFKSGKNLENSSETHVDMAEHEKF